ncbi:MAG: ABC transporter permease [Caldiserica bacterium]|nr:ABC transporter permease [Caldisericota bacterium]
MGQKTAAGRVKSPPRFFHLFALWLRQHPEFGAFAGTVIVFIGFSFTATRFLTADSMASILTVAAELGIVSAGITFLMISGEFDLSVGSVLGVAAMIFAMTSKAGWPHLAGWVLALLASAGIGLLNGIIVTRTRIPSFITTLGAMMFWRGILLAVTGGFPISYFPREMPLMFFALNGRFAGQFRTSALWFLGIMLLLNLVLVRTRYGNAVYATGGNREAARVLGVATDKVKLINFVISAVLAGLAGCIQFSRFLSVDPMRGLGLELEAIAAAVIGGTLLTGGAGNLIGTLFGVLLVGMVRSGLVQAGAPAYWYQAFVGLIVVVAVIVNTNLRRWALK